MKRRSTIFTTLLALTVFSFSAKAQTIVIDGNFTDWNAVPYSHQNTEGTGGRLQALKIFGTATHLYFMVEGSTEMDFGTLLVHLDTDNNPATGYNNSWQYGAGAGSDYRIEGNAPWWGGLYRHSGDPADDWAGFTEIESLATDPNPSPVHVRSNVVESGGKKYFEFSITKSYLGTLGAFINIAIYDTTDPATGSIPAINIPTQAKYLQINATGSTTLPVALASFTASPTVDAVKINWSTYSEQNNSHFELYKSIDGLKFDKITSINGAVNSNSQLFYTYTDYNLSNGSSYYELKQVDLDGKVTSVGIVEVKTKLKSESFAVYKLKDENVIEIRIVSEKSTPSQFILSDISGRMLIDQTFQLVAGSQLFKLPLPLISGIGVATLTSPSKIVSQKIFID